MTVYAVGSRVRQPSYGPGTVTMANERHTTIDFDEHGVRTFVTTMVTLEPTGEPAPPGSGRRAPRKRAPRKKPGTVPDPAA